MRTKRSRMRPTHRSVARSEDASLRHQQQYQQQTSSYAVDLLDDDNDDLLFSAASILLHEGSSDSFELSATDVGFSSFQALLEAAATSVTPAATRDPTTKAARTADSVGDDNAARAAADCTAYSKNRRERNRISCRKTRIKRKTEQARANLVARKRAEHGEFLSELHLELTAQDLLSSRADVLERERAARHLVVRSVHLQLMDAEYDASWCFAPSPQAAKAEMAAQWRAITADFAVADLSILEIRDVEQGSAVVCEWCVIGTPGEQFQDGSNQVERRSVAGETHVRFRDQLVASVEMRVTNASAFDIAV